MKRKWGYWNEKRRAELSRRVEGHELVRTEEGVMGGVGIYKGVCVERRRRRGGWVK